MKTNRNGNILEVILEGSLGESSPLYTLKLDGLTDLVLNMNAVTYMNSVGVKEWIVWTDKLPRSLRVSLIHAPMMIVSQASAVVGFMKPQMKINSMKIPYACDDCGTEETHMVTRGMEYEYANPHAPEKVDLPNRKCRKCGKETLEADVIVAKTFKFLKD